jgi:hypothetical protein
VLGDLDVYADYAPAAFAAGGEMRLAAAGHAFTRSAIRGDLPGLLAGTAEAPTGAPGRCSSAVSVSASRTPPSPWPPCRPRE